LTLLPDVEAILLIASSAILTWSSNNNIVANVAKYYSMAFLFLLAIIFGPLLIIALVSQLTSNIVKPPVAASASIFAS